MEPHLEHTHGRHYEDPNTLIAGHLTGHDHNDDHEHHGEKKSVIKKVKEKAKKLKNTITGHGHDHHDDQDDDDDEDDDETIEDPEVHGAPMYDSSRVVGLGGPSAILAQGRGNLERPSVMYEDRYTEPWASSGAPPSVPTGTYGTNLSRPSNLGHTQAYGQEVNPQNWRGKIGQPSGKEEDPFAPNSTRVASPIDLTNPTYGTIHGGEGPEGQDVNQGGLRGIIGKSTGMVEDPHAPKDPSRSGSDPSNYETEVTDPTHTGDKEANLSQIQHSFDKVGIRDDESGYDPKSFDPNHPENLPHETLPGKIPSSASAIAEKDKMADKGVSVKEYLMETLRPGDEDKALSEVITNAFHRGNQGESEKKSGEDRPMGIVTESVEVRQRLGTDRTNEHEQNSGNVSADKGVSERLRDAVGSWFGGEGDAPQGTLGTSYVTDHVLSSNPAGDQRNGSGNAQ